LECAGEDQSAASAPTTFGLPQPQVRKLIALGSECVKNSPILRRFLKLVAVSGTKEECSTIGQLRDQRSQVCVPADINITQSWTLLEHRVHFDDGSWSIRPSDDA